MRTARTFDVGDILEQREAKVQHALFRALGFGCLFSEERSLSWAEHPHEAGNPI